LISNQLVTYIVTDHVSLSYLKYMSLLKNTSLVCRSLYLQDYQLDINLKSSAKIKHTDVLSHTDRSQNEMLVAPSTDSNATLLKTL